MTLIGVFGLDSNEVTVGGENCPIITQSDSIITCTIPANIEGTTVISQQTLKVIHQERSSNEDKLLTYLGAELTLWFDADDDSSFTLTNDEVTQWNDKSGSNRHASGGTSPERILDASIGKNLVRFNGVDQWLNIPSANWGDLTVDLETSTILAVIKPLETGPVPNAGITYRGDGIIGDSTAFFGLYLVDGGLAGGIDGVTDRSAPIIDVALDETILGIITHNAGELSLSVNDLVRTSTTPGAIKPGGAAAVLRLGKNYNTFENFYSGEIGEVLIFSRLLSDDELSIISNVLKTNWKIN